MATEIRPRRRLAVKMLVRALIVLRFLRTRAKPARTPPRQPLISRAMKAGLMAEDGPIGNDEPMELGQRLSGVATPMSKPYRPEQDQNVPFCPIAFGRRFPRQRPARRRQRHRFVEGHHIRRPLQRHLAGDKVLILGRTAARMMVCSLSRLRERVGERAVSTTGQSPRLRKPPPGALRRPPPQAGEVAAEFAAIPSTTKRPAGDPDGPLDSQS